jgi:protein-tyrosine phosphatase
VARILTICTANVCRSPAAAGILAALERFDVIVESAGVAADDGRPMCPVARDWLSTQVGVDLGETQRSRLLNAEILGRNDLVIVASLRQRRLAAAMAPSVISRLFTYTEAATLARHANLRRRSEQPRHRRADAPIDGSTGTLTEFVREMGALRGIVRLTNEEDDLTAEISGSRWTRFRRSTSENSPTKAVSPYDVPDAHTSRGRDHEPTFDALGPALLELVVELSACLGPDRAPLGQR